MFIIRETFTAKPGMASKLAGLFKETFAGQADIKLRVLTDHIGPFNTVVLETEVDDLAAFEQRMKEYTARTDIRDRMKGYAELYTTGRREVYKTV